MRNSSNNRFKYWFIVGLLLMVVAGCAQEPDVTEPNLLVIMTDEHNFRTLGSYREHLPHDQANIWGDGVNVKTPNIDQLADQGALFSNFYAVTPLCTPSRAAFVSGMYPQATGMTRNYQTMPDSVTTFAHILKRNGYITGYAGKWHLDGYGKPQWSPKRTFGFTNNKYMFNRGHWKKLKDTDQGPVVAAVNKKGNPNYDLDGADENTFATDFLTDRAIDFIDGHKNQKFAYMLSYPDPHGPDRVRAPYDTMYTNMDFEFPKTYFKQGDDWPTWAQKRNRVTRSNQSQYFGMVKALDENIGRLIDHLRRQQLLQNTIVVFTSDHGDFRTEHRRMNKGSPLEASAKVPFIVYHPPSVKSNAVVDQAANSVDFAPTVLSLMEQQIPREMQGQNLSPLITGAGIPDEFKEVTFSRSDSWVAAITSRYKLIFSKNNEPWLIDKEEDPDEVFNFISSPDKTEVVKKLARDLEEYGNKYKDPLLSNDKITDELSSLLDG